MGYSRIDSSQTLLSKSFSEQKSSGIIVHGKKMKMNSIVLSFIVVPCLSSSWYRSARSSAETDKCNAIRGQYNATWK